MNLILENVTEDQSITFFRKAKEKEPIICKSCQNTNFFWIESKKQYQCKVCSSRVSLKSGTVMQYSKLPFRIWFISMVLVAESSKPISANNLRKLLGLKRYQPVWELLHKLRNCMSVSDIQSFKENLNCFVRFRCKNAYSKKTNTSGFMTWNHPNHSGKYRLSIVYEKSINKYINLPNCKETLARSFQTISDTSCLPVIVKKKDVPIWTKKYMNFNLQNVKGTYHHVNEKYIQNYLSEYCFHLNCNLQKVNRFDKLLEACMSGVWYRKSF
jgi:hypothetical protein